MSRLDSFIRRMSAQRDILNAVAPRLTSIPGPLLEFGLGSGRTFDHLRELCPDRRIVVFESVAGTSPISQPPAGDLVVGDLRDTTRSFPDACAALIHADIETGVAEQDAQLATWLPALIARLLVPGGYAVSGAPLVDPRLAPEALPAGIDAHRYHLARRR